MFEAAFAACRPAFSAFASDIFYLGPAGAGQVGKMVNNLILWACTSANDEGLRLGEALGVDADKLRAALHHSSAQNWAMDQRAERSGMPWAEKDMSIVLHEADLARLSLPLSGTVKETIKGLKIRLRLGVPLATHRGDGPLLLRLSDPRMLAVTEELTRAGIRYFGPRPEVMQVCYDKLQATRLAAADGVDCPANALGSAAGSITFPLVVKPRRGSDSLGLRVLAKGPLPARVRNGDYIAQELIRGTEVT